MYIQTPNDKKIGYDDLGGKTIKQYLLEQGMEEKDFDTYEGTLYVRKTPISERFKNLWEYGSQWEIFIDNIEGQVWYDVPFGYMSENIKEREEFNRRTVENLKEWNRKEVEE